MVENEEITGTMRGCEGDNDPVSEFIGNAFGIFFTIAGVF
jgi:hypothetical protein